MPADPFALSSGQLTLDRLTHVTVFQAKHTCHCGDTSGHRKTYLHMSCRDHRTMLSDAPSSAGESCQDQLVNKIFK